jgi:hypothetical protein
VNGTGSGSRPVVDFDISGVETWVLLPQCYLSYTGIKKDFQFYCKGGN